MEKSESSTRCKYSHSDRISSLPEALHSRILSLLPTKDAVATSILSKRWKFVWTCITNVTLDYGPRFKSNVFNIMNTRKFTEFVNSVLVQLNPPRIQNLYLWYRHNRSDPFFQSVVCSAIEQIIQKLEIWLWLDKPMELPLSHFNCTTLTLLKLGGDIHFNVVASASVCFSNLLTIFLACIRFTIASNCSVSFPSLKDMHLDNVKYANQESVHKLFASCPVLDSLYLRRWYCTKTRYHSFDNRRFDNIRCFIISIPSLRSLQTYSHCDSKLEHHTCHEYKVKIDAPALECLILHDRSFCEFTLENLSCLVDAEVKFDFDQLSEVEFDFDQLSDIELEDIQKIQENFSKFIGGLYNVKFLSIPGPILKAIGSISENIAPVFRNLIRLELEILTCRDFFTVIKNLLERSDNLEHLTIKGINCWGCHASWWMQPLSVPMCLQRGVTTIDFPISGDCNSELDLVRYFLLNAEVLELLTIDCLCDSEAMFNLVEEISMSPRGSRACQVKSNLMENDGDFEYDL